MRRLRPDNSKTELVESLICGELVVQQVRVRVRACPNGTRDWMVLADTVSFEPAPGEEMETVVVAICPSAPLASAVAHAVAGSVDCDLLLGADLERELGQ